MSEPREYYLCFIKSKTFYRWWLSRKFNHVFVLYKDNICWWQFNVLSCELKHKIVGVKLEHDLPGALQRTLKMSYVKVKVERDKHAERLWNPFWMMNCVNIVKFFTGIRMPCFTSYGMWKKLVKMHDRQDYKYGIVDIEFISQYQP